MQDKIQEIMGLVDALSVECIAFGIGQMASSTEDKATLGDDVKKARAIVESKLRELVREPLSLERIYEIEAVSNVAHTRTTYTEDCWGDNKKETEEVRVFSFPLFARNIERAHGITKGDE